MLEIVNPLKYETVKKIHVTSHIVSCKVRFYLLRNTIVASKTSAWIAIVMLTEVAVQFDKIISVNDIDVNAEFKIVRLNLVTWLTTSKVANCKKKNPDETTKLFYSAAKATSLIYKECTMNWVWRNLASLMIFSWKL